MRAYAYRDQKMPISPFLLIQCLVGIVFLFSNSQRVDLTHICIKVTSLLAILIEIIFPCPLSLVDKSTDRPQKVKQILSYRPSK